MITQTNCSHSVHNHLFRSPFCQKQSKLTKIAIVAFYILTLGIPLASYHIISSLKGRVRVVEKLIEPDPVIGQKIAPFPLIGKEAMAFAMEKLKENPDISQKYKTSKSQPTNNIDPFVDLEEIYYGKFKKALKQHKKNPWRSQEVIQAADSLMKISYAVTCLPIEGLTPLSERQTNGAKKTFAEIQIDQKSYHNFFHSTVTYHNLRGEIGIIKNCWYNKEWDSRKEIVDFPGQTISQGHADEFYKEGTIQNSWKILYNDSCDRINIYITDKIPEQHLLNWIQKDLGAETFSRMPDTTTLMRPHK